MAWSDRERWLHFVFLGDGWVGNKMERDEKRWCKSLLETGTKRIFCASQFTIPDTAGTSPDLPCNYTNTRSSHPNWASCTPDFSYALISCTSFSSSSAISLFLVHYSTIIAERNVKSYLSISPCNDPELTPCTVYTKYNIHWLQRTPSRASTHDCLSNFHTHYYEWTPECSFIICYSSQHDQPPSTSSPWELKRKVTLSQFDVRESKNWWIESQHPVYHSSTAS